jgi:hypothetical protein
VNEIVLTVLNFDIGNSSLAITRKRQQLPFGLAITKERQLLKERSRKLNYLVLGSTCMFILDCITNFIGKSIHVYTKIVDAIFPYI